MFVDGIERNLPGGVHYEYDGVYRRFAEGIRTAKSDCTRPIEIVADAFLLGRVERLEAFAF